MPVNCLEQSSVVGTLDFFLLFTVEVKCEAGLGCERSMLERTRNFFWDVVLRATIELEGSEVIGVVGLDDAIVLLHVFATTTPVEVQVNDYKR